MKLMKVVTYLQWVRILQFSVKVVGKAVAGLDLVGDIVRCFVVRVSDMDDGYELLH